MKLSASLGGGGIFIKTAVKDTKQFPNYRPEPTGDRKKKTDITVSPVGLPEDGRCASIIIGRERNHLFSGLNQTCPHCPCFGYLLCIVKFERVVEPAKGRPAGGSG